MARQEQDREDILREATALIERAELQITGAAESVVIGFRRNGCASVYFGAEPVYQFNERNELRRAYAQGKLIKADGGCLVRMERLRESAATVLHSQPFTQEEETAFLALAQIQLSQLHAAIAEQRFQLLGQVPVNLNVLTRIRDWLASLPAKLVAADAPNVG